MNMKTITHDPARELDAVFQALLESTQEAPDEELLADVPGDDRECMAHTTRQVLLDPVFEEEHRKREARKRLVGKLGVLASSAELSTEAVRKRYRTIGMVAAIALLGTVASLWVIAARLPQTDEARLVAAFALIGSIIVIAASVSTFVITFSSVALYKYFQAQAGEAIAKAKYERTRRAVRRVPHLLSTESFCRELVELVLEEKDRLNVPPGSQSQSLVVLICERDSFQVGLSEAIDRQLCRIEDDPPEALEPQ